MGLFFRLGKQDLARALDEKGRNKAVLANILPLLVSLAGLIYWIVTKDFRPIVALIVSIALLLSFILGVHIQSRAVIESVYRGKDDRTKKIYKKHKAYFDKEFRKHKQALHKSTHIQ